MSEALRDRNASMPDCTLSGDPGPRGSLSSVFIPAGRLGRDAPERRGDRQFGAEPTKASDNVTVQNFRKDCVRELKKIKRAWPELNYGTAKGVLILSPSKPSIPRLAAHGKES